MARRARVRNVHAILALSAGLVLLVLATFGWMGWVVLGDAKRREDVAKVLERSALDASADQIVASFRRNVDERRAALRGMPATSLPTPPAGTVLVRLSRQGVEDVQPPGGLLFAPAVPRTEPDSEVFALARRLEFQLTAMVESQASERTASSDRRSATLAALRTALDASVRSADPRIRAEALFRLFRVQLATGDVKAAEASYARLRDEKRLGPSADLPPYGFLVRLLWISRARTQKVEGAWVAMRPPPPHETREAAAAALLDSLLSGEWLMRRAAYEFYQRQLRQLIGDSHAPPQMSDSGLAVAELIDVLWNDWKATGFRTDAAAARLESVSAPAPVLAVADAGSGQMVVALHTGDALSRLFRDRDAERAGAVDVMVTDEDGGRIFGGLTPAGTRVARLNVEPSLPWRVEVAAAGTGVPVSTASAGEQYLLGVLIAVALLVSLACYAIARGVLRESAAGRLQADFVSAVSHEFRSPLTTLRQLTELLADGRVADEDRRRRYFGVLQQEAARLHQLVENLLDFGRMDAGGRPYQFESLDLSDLVRHGIEEYRTQAGANGHAIEAEFSPDRLVVDADPEAMRRALRNLLDNAVKYSPDASTVWVATTCEDRRAVVRVRDAGIGIPAHEQPRIFDEFVRGDAAKRACIRGTGIGLAMVKTIVRAHHGEVRVSSEVGSGSTFELRLPLCHARAGSAS